MKPTQEQMTLLTVAHCSGRTLYDAIMAVTEYWETIRPRDDRWIPITERRPTMEDKDDRGYILVWNERGRVSGAASYDYLANFSFTHWRRTNIPPAPLTAEEIEAQEMDDKFMANDADDFKSFKAGWLAHKSKQS